MKKIILIMLFTVTYSAISQINTRTGGAINVLPNSPTSNTNVGIGTNKPTEKLEVVGKVKSKSLLGINDIPSNSISSNVDYFNNSLVLGVGKPTLYNSVTYPGFNGNTCYGFNVYDLYKSPNIRWRDEIFVNIVDRSGKERFYFRSAVKDVVAGYSDFGIRDDDSNELMKFSDELPGVFYLHMPQNGSRIVIGGWGNTLPEHKFVVNNGSSYFNGNVGIETSNFTDGTDTYKLSVNGAIRAHRVKVYTTWADFVFEDGYNLPTLAEVEQHIKDKGHLIDIPSAKEVADNGIELGEMNKKLLQKVEELTLYIIELNKELEKIKDKLKK